MKKVLSIIITALMLVSALPIISTAESTLPFTDVKEGAWYYEGIEYCYGYGIVNGMTETTFVPSGTLTRAQFVQMLAMYDGANLEEYKTKDSGFEDVKTNHWFNAPVCWAVEQGYVAGMSPTEFGPNEKITREQLARLLYLYAETYGGDISVLADLSDYEDESKVSDWAYEQVQWAVAAGIISGTSETTLSARATATRAQACRMMMTFDIFMMYGFRDMSGAFEVIAEYIKAHGTVGDSSRYISVTEDYDGYSLSLEYDGTIDLINIYYFADPFEETDGDELTAGYRTWGSMQAHGLDCAYDLTYSYEDGNGKYMQSYGSMYIDRYEEHYSETEGFEEETRIQNAENIANIIRDRIAVILASADMTLEDFFLPEHDDVYDALVQYISENGEEMPGSDSMVMYKELGDKAYVAEYAPESNNLAFVYVSEPLPGGSDIYDTQYREHAIIVLDSFKGEDYFMYTYLNGDAEEIVAEGTFNGTDVTVATLEQKGFSDEEAQNKIDNGIIEVVNYYNEVLGAALAVNDPDPAYEALVQYVSENGEEAPFGGSIVLYTYEGDKAYVTEYVPETGELCFVYAADPIPGGTDVYDTEYREHAILLLDATLGDDFFLYTYTSEDETSTVAASGTTDSNTLNVDELVYDGISEGEAETMMEAGMSEVISYSLEVLNLATETV